MNHKPIFTRIFLLFFILLSLSIPFISHGKGVRKKDNGNVITDAEWERAIKCLDQKLGNRALQAMAQALKRAKDKTPMAQASIRESVGRTLAKILETNGFDWGNASLNRHSLELLEEALKQSGGKEEGTESVQGVAGISALNMGGESADNENEASNTSVKESEQQESTQKTGIKYKYVWRGTLTSEMVKLGQNINIATTFNVSRVNWEEAGEIKLYDKSGHLTGKFVLLRDAGSTWEGNASGFLGEAVYSGNGKGTGHILGHGTIYYSLSDDDPLKDKLPNGVYFLDSSNGSFFNTIVTLPGGGTSTFPTRPLFYIGCGKYHIVFPAISTRKMDVESIEKAFARGCYRSPFQVDKTWQPPRFDRETRVVENNQMKGKYESRSYSPNSVNNLQNITRCTWNLHRVMNISPELDDVDKDWRPKKDDVIQVTARLPEGSGLKGKWKFELYDVTKEKGYCMNAGDEKGFDLEFVKDQSGFEAPEKTGGGWKIETKDEYSEITVKIKANDYGAWAKVSAKVNINGEWVTAEATNGKSYITLPYDEDENRIADCWEEKYGIKGQAASSDNDPKPEEITCQTGDGFTNYEEYRGFSVNGSWTDTDPTQRDIFIYDGIGYGAGRFDSSKIEIHLINEDEYDAQRVVNFNRGYATLQDQNGQKGLYLMEKDLGEPDENGILIEGETEEIGTPNVVDWVAINTVCVSRYSERRDHLDDLYEKLAELDVLYGNLRAHYSLNEFDAVLEEYDKYMGWEDEIEMDKASSEGVKKDVCEDEINDIKNQIDEMKSRIEDEEKALENVGLLGVTIAHELGHAVNLPHHGFSFKEEELTEKYHEPIAVEGGVYSGDPNCVMRYNYAKKYLGTDGKLHEYPENYRSAHQTYFCLSKEGKGNPAGDATCGECWKNMTLKGYARHPDGCLK